MIFLIIVYRNMGRVIPSLRPDVGGVTEIHVVSLDYPYCYANAYGFVVSLEEDLVHNLKGIVYGYIHPSEFPKEYKFDIDVDERTRDYRMNRIFSMMQDLTEAQKELATALQFEVSTAKPPFC